MFQVANPLIIRSSYHCICSIRHYWDRTATCLERVWMGTGSQTDTFQTGRSTVSIMPDTADTVIWAPDYECRYHSKYVEQFTNVNKLYVVESCSTIIDISELTLVMNCFFVIYVLLYDILLNSFVSWGTESKNVHGISKTIICIRHWDDPRTILGQEEFLLLKIPNDPIGILTRDPPACSSVSRSVLSPSWQEFNNCPEEAGSTFLANVVTNLPHSTFS
jgi:hypothetical protein